MPAVLVHGVPETSALWEPLRSHLHRSDVVAVSLPGFGCPRPDGFGATKEEYVAWLVDQLEGLQSEGTIDLVGHDWGGGLTVRLVSTRPDLVRSWVVDVAGFGDTNFEWHDLAKIWQTPGAGEEFFEQQWAAPIEKRVGVLEQLGIPHEHALAMVDEDRTMADCILALYRSALDIGSEWGPEFRDIPAPGLALLPGQDPFQSRARSSASAANAGAEVVELPDLGHWWMLQDPARSATILEKFWASLD